jgi:hypothetical protein
MAKRTDPFEGGIKTKKPIPFDFVLDALESLGPETRPMFGCTAVYVGERMHFILRDKGPGDADSGVWIAYQPEHQAEVFSLFPALQKVEVFGDKVAGWRKLSSRSPDFEDDVLRACKLVRARDPRLGKIPGAKKAKAAAKKAPEKKAPEKKAPEKKAQRPK